MSNDLAQMIARNNYARARILGEAVPVVQKIASLTQATAAYTAGQATVLNLPLQNVGLIKRLWIRVKATIVQSAAETHTLQTFGPSAFFSNVTLTDLQNLVRVNTSGIHLGLVSSARRQLAFPAAFTSDAANGIGANYNIQSAPSSLTTSNTLYASYEIPVAYSDTDLRGAIFANVVSATMNLQLTINPNFSVVSTADAVQSVYKSSTTDLAKITAYTIDVYQEYLDQLPRENGAYVLPEIDLATQYNLIGTTYQGMVANSDYSIPYANLRSYLSTFLVYDNGGTLNAGTDINSFSLVMANTMKLFQYDAYIAQLLNGRCKINDDWPKGTYYFPTRDKGLQTLAWGNVNLNVNASSVSANSQILAFFEYLAQTTQLMQASAIGSM